MAVVEVKLARCPPYQLRGTPVGTPGHIVACHMSARPL